MFVMALQENVNQRSPAQPENTLIGIVLTVLGHAKLTIPERAKARVPMDTMAFPPALERSSMFPTARRAEHL